MFRSLFAISDEQAMWRVQTQDDHGAFAMLVERWREKIRQLCIRMTGNPHNGEDLAQDVFARVFERRREFNPTKRFSTWLWRIALNRCCDDRVWSRPAAESQSGRVCCGRNTPKGADV